MTFLISSVYTFLYVTVIIMGGITMTLMLILNIEKRKESTELFFFSYVRYLYL